MYINKLELLIDNLDPFIKKKEIPNEKIIYVNKPVQRFHENMVPKEDDYITNRRYKLKQLEPKELKPINMNEYESMLDNFNVFDKSVGSSIFL